MSKRERIDFNFVRQEADFLTVLAHYGLVAHGSGVQRQVLCPFHADKKPSLKVNLGRKVFNCFGCGASGNVIEFVRRKEGLDQDEVRAAARKLASICSIPLAPPTGTVGMARNHPKEPGSGPETIATPPEPETPRSEPPGASGEVPAEAANAPIDPAFAQRFRAKLVASHPYLEARGLKPETLKAFGVSFFALPTGMMRQRVVLELHDEKGQLLAWVGRWVGDEADLPEGQGKYLFPAKFHKSHLLYNLHRVKRDIWRDGFVTIVEGYWSVMVLYELGIPAVALMGRTLSTRQLALLTTLRTKRVTVLLDGDEPGYDASAQVAAQLANTGILTKALFLPDGAQPDTWLQQLQADDSERLQTWLSAI